MYADHVPVIAGAMRASPECFKRGVMFAVLSARVQFPRVPDACADLKRRGTKSPHLWGWKFDAYAFLTDNLQTLYGQMTTAQTLADAMAVITTIPGLGIVKGGFVCQLMGWDIACIDTRNIKREGREPDAFKVNKKSKAFRERMAAYLAEFEGRAIEYWDLWCADVADGYGMTAQQVSQMHLDAIVPRRMRTPGTFCMVPIRATEIPF